MKEEGFGQARGILLAKATDAVCISSATRPVTAR